MVSQDREFLQGMSVRVIPQARPIPKLICNMQVAKQTAEKARQKAEREQARLKKEQEKQARERWGLSWVPHTSTHTVQVLGVVVPVHAFVNRRETHIANQICHLAAQREAGEGSCQREGEAGEGEGAAGQREGEAGEGG